MSRTKRASTRFEPAPADPFAGNLDPTTPWAVLPSTLAAISQFMRRGVSAELLAEHSKDPVPTAQVRGARTAGGGAGVAILSLRGLITPRSSFLSLLFGGGGGLESFRATLREALADDDIAAILLDIDSPGGAAALIPELAQEILAARAVKPVVAVANTLAASAAYWIASAATEIVVTPSGRVGSIGVYSAHSDISAAQEKMGVKTTLVSAGEYKVEKNPYEPLSDDARAEMQREIDAVYEMFLSAVAKGRDVSVKDVREKYGQGRVLLAKDALAVGMVDRIATFDQTLARLEKQAGRTSTTRSQAPPEPEPSAATTRTIEPERSVATTRTAPIWGSEDAPYWRL